MSQLEAPPSAAVPVDVPDTPEEPLPRLPGGPRPGTPDELPPSDASGADPAGAFDASGADPEGLPDVWPEPLWAVGEAPDAAAELLLTVAGALDGFIEPECATADPPLPPPGCGPALLPVLGPADAAPVLAPDDDVREVSLAVAAESAMSSLMTPPASNASRDGGSSGRSSVHAAAATTTEGSANEPVDHQRHDFFTNAPCTVVAARRRWRGVPNMHPVGRWCQRTHLLDARMGGVTSFGALLLPFRCDSARARVTSALTTRPARPDACGRPGCSMSRALPSCATKSSVPKNGTVQWGSA